MYDWLFYFKIKMKIQISILTLSLFIHHVFSLSCYFYSNTIGIHANNIDPTYKSTDSTGSVGLTYCIYQSNCALPSQHYISSNCSTPSSLYQTSTRGEISSSNLTAFKNTITSFYSRFNVTDYKLVICTTDGCNNPANFNSSFIYLPPIKPSLSCFVSDSYQNLKLNLTNYSILTPRFTTCIYMSACLNSTSYSNQIYPLSLPAIVPCGSLNAQRFTKTIGTINYGLQSHASLCNEMNSTFFSMTAQVNDALFMCCNTNACNNPLLVTLPPTNSQVASQTIPLLQVTSQVISQTAYQSIIVYQSNFNASLMSVMPASSLGLGLNTFLFSITSTLTTQEIQTRLYSASIPTITQSTNQVQISGTQAMALISIVLQTSTMRTASLTTNQVSSFPTNTLVAGIVDSTPKSRALTLRINYRVLLLFSFLIMM